MIKKILKTTIVILMLVLLVACKPKQENPESKPPVIVPPIVEPIPEPEETEEFKLVATNFVSQSEEYQFNNGTIDLLFNGKSAIPFVSVKNYLLLLDGGYLSQEFEFVYSKSQLDINLNILYSNGEEYQETMIINSDSDTVNVSSLDFFSLYLERPETNYSENLVNLDPLYQEGESVTYNLGAYFFDIINYESDVYMPLVIVNLLFNQDMYFDTYYNGETLYGVDTSTLEDNEIKTLITSKYNNDEIPKDIAEYNYYFYTFIIDYFYGLKNDRNIENAKNFIDKDAFLKNNMDINIFNTVKALDDLHTSHLSRGYYNNPTQQVWYKDSRYGPIVDKFYTEMYKVQDEAVKYFGVKSGYINFKDYEYIDNDKTLIIYIMNFDVDTPVKMEKILKSAKPTTENIIIDLAYNTGGNIGAVLRMFALMTNEVIPYHIINPLNNEKVTYRVKAERKAYDQYNYYIKTSSITFSAANLASSIAKELGIKVIGRKSSGGASAISFFVFPNGAMIIMSSNMVLTDKSYISIENGIEVDYHMANLYDKNDIINAINK